MCESAFSEHWLHCGRLFTYFGVRMVSRADGFASPGATPAKSKEAPQQEGLHSLAACRVS